MVAGDDGGGGLSPVSVEPLAAEAVKHHRHNFLVTVVFQVVLRCGWIFKTESIVIPAVLLIMGAQGWLRGFLPVISRLGMCLPPLLLASRIRVFPRKKWLVFACTGMMAACFLTLAVTWKIVPLKTPWLPAGFLAIYALFFVAVGVNNLVGNTIQGKLIKVKSRGRLLKLSSFWGAAFAILLAGLLMPGWLKGENGSFQWIFGFTGVCFAIAAVIVLKLKEYPDEFQDQVDKPAWRLRDILAPLRQDIHFRRLCLVAGLFSVSVMLFPHYQPMAKDKLDFNLMSLVIWVMVQNTGTGLFSVIVGPIADRHGYRLVLRLLLIVVAATPLLAITLASSSLEGRGLYWSVFVLIGLTPVIMKTLLNYTLEMAPAQDHTRYLAIMSLSISGPLMVSPIAGVLIDRFSYAPVFIGVALVVGIGWLLTFTLLEPRNRQ
jgi:MFS family permease